MLLLRRWLVSILSGPVLMLLLPPLLMPLLPLAVRLTLLPVPLPLLPLVVSPSLGQEKGGSLRLKLLLDPRVWAWRGGLPWLAWRLRRRSAWRSPGIGRRRVVEAVTVGRGVGEGCAGRRVVEAVAVGGGVGGGCVGRRVGALFVGAVGRVGRRVVEAASVRLRCTRSGLVEIAAAEVRVPGVEVYRVGVVAGGTGRGGRAAGERTRA